MEPAVKLNVPDLIDTILCKAVVLHDPDDLDGMLACAAVFRRADCPNVLRTIFNHAWILSMDGASECGRVDYLKMRVALRFPLRYTGAAMAKAAEAGWIEVLHWWRASGLSLPTPVKMEKRGRVFFDLDQHGNATTPAAGDAVVDGLRERIQEAPLRGEIFIGARRMTARGTQVFAELLQRPPQWTTKLTLETCDLDFASASAFRNADMITELNLTGNFAGYGAPDEIAEPWLPRNLHTLSLHDNFLGKTAPAAILAHLPPHLTSLNLSENDLTEDQVLVLADNLPASLLHLYLSDTVLTPDGMAALAPRLPPRLETLHLNQTDFDDDCAALLAPHLPRRLRVLALSNSLLTDVGMSALAAAFPTTLRELGLSDNEEHGDKAVAALAAAMPPNLTRLDVSGTPLGDAGAAALAAAPLPCGLRHLKLQSCDLTSAGVTALAPALPRSLQTLHLGSNAIGADWVGALVANTPPGLSELHLPETGMNDDDAVRELLGALPNSIMLFDLNDNDVSDDMIAEVQTELMRRRIQVAAQAFLNVGPEALNVNLGQLPFPFPFPL
ncbi:hypothetical protein H9P43_000255 [Blastocladiella emersonii ATCC 22665]|nr:hypothetical protein H9P43_000255 [Blastocladiella emersonii ATCC 22665]